jgi:AcrR family transcriptional regulator
VKGWLKERDHLALAKCQIDRTVRSTGIDIAQLLPHIKIELNGSVKICDPPAGDRPKGLGAARAEGGCEAMEQATGHTPAMLLDEGRDPPQDSAKRRQIIEGARSVFLSQGFDRASMDEIARAAGVSKGTLYVYFSNKQRLFEELIVEDRRVQAEQVVALDPADPDIRQALTRFGVSLCEMLQRPQTVALIRMVIAVSGQFPDVGRALYASGPGHGIKRVSTFFDAQVARGALAMADTELAAAQFIELCHCRTLKPLLFAVSGPASRETIEANVTSAIDMILSKYGPRPEAA